MFLWYLLLLLLILLYIYIYIIDLKQFLIILSVVQNFANYIYEILKTDIVYLYEWVGNPIITIS